MKMVLSVLLLIPVLSCQIEAPQNNDQQSHHSPIEKQVIASIEESLEETAPAIEIIQTLSSLGRLSDREARSNRVTKAAELKGHDKLLSGYGNLQTFEQQTGYFEYTIDSEAAFELSKSGESLNIVLSGYIQENPVKPVIAESTLIAEYTKDTRTQRFQLYYQKNHSSEVSYEILIELQELSNLYNLLTKSKTNSTQSIGTLLIKVDPNMTKIEGQNVTMHGERYDAKFSDISLEIHRQGSQAAKQETTQINGKILDKKLNEVGTIKVESKYKDKTRHLVFKIDFKD